MRALTYAAYGPVENLVTREVPPPSARRGELVVEVHRAALNPKDALFRKGRFALLSGRTFPKRCGLDFAGIVRESRSPHFSRGQRVFGAISEWRFLRGTLAEQVCVSDEEAAPTPDGVSHDEAAALGTAALTALQALRDFARVRRGTRVWIHGASGGVGTLAVQLARAMGAEVTTTSSAENLALCADLGAHRTLDYTKSPVEVLRGSIDVIFDVFGNLRPADVAPAFAGRGALVSTIPTPKRVALEALARVFPVRQRLIVVRSRRADLADLGARVASGSLRPVIDARFPLAQAHEAFRRLESKRARGKIVVEL